MGNEQFSQTQNNDLFVNLKKPTAVSKYLSFLLFILLPFLGGYLGYVYKSEQIIFRESLSPTSSPGPEDSANKTKISKENVELSETNTQKIFPSLAKFKPNEVVGDFMFEKTELIKVGDQNAYQAIAYFKGKTTITGRISVANEDMFGTAPSRDFPYTVKFYPDEESTLNLPLLASENNEYYSPSSKQPVNFNIQDLEKSPFVLQKLAEFKCDLENYCSSLKPTYSELLTLEIEDFEIVGQNYPSGIPYHAATSLLK